MAKKQKKNKKKKSSKRAKRVFRARVRKSARRGAKVPARKKFSPRASRASLAKSAAKQDAKIKSLIKLGKERGYITYDEILREFPTIEDNVTLLDDMYERFGVAGIDVLEGCGMLEDTSP